MAHRRSRPQRPPEGGYPQYEWALDSAGEPVPIDQAVRGAYYICPLCRGRMVAKLGDVKRHHFAHEEIRFCPPDEVARLAAGRWLQINLQRCLKGHRSILITWPCPVCQEIHTADLLEGITQVEQHVARDGITADLALLDAGSAIRSVIALFPPPHDVLAAASRQQIAVIVIGLEGIRRRMHDLASLLQGSIIHGGICTTQIDAARRGIVTDIPTLRQLLTEAAYQPPYHYYGPLEQDGALTHVFTLGSRKLWLPPILWQRAIGGLLHSINPALQIISQEWPQPDGGTIALYYVTVKETYAIAVRRFPPGSPVYARLDAGVFRVGSGRATAVDVARGFAEL